jgi:hypothetical protein
VSKGNSKTSPPVDLDNLSINTIRFLLTDAAPNTYTGHPGLPMGAAAFTYVLWTRFQKHNPSNPKWFIGRAWVDAGFYLLPLRWERMRRVGKHRLCMSP